MPLKNKPKKSLDYDQTVFTFKMNEASFKSFPTFVQIVKQVLQTTQSKTSLWEILQMRNIFYLQNYFVIFYISTKWSCYRFLKRVEYSTKNMINDHFVYCELRDLKYQINPRTKFKFKETNLSKKRLHIANMGTLNCLVFIVSLSHTYLFHAKQGQYW